MLAGAAMAGSLPHKKGTRQSRICGARFRESLPAARSSSRRWLSFSWRAPASLEKLAPRERSERGGAQVDSPRHPSLDVLVFAAGLLRLIGLAGVGFAIGRAGLGRAAAEV